MKPIKFIMYWVAFNVNPENDTSLLFDLCFIISLPVLFVWAFISVGLNSRNIKDERKEKFWIGWKNLEEG